MSQSDQFDSQNSGNEEDNIAVDTYRSENSEEIYNTPGVSDDSSDVIHGEDVDDETLSVNEAAPEIVDNGGQEVQNDHSYGGQEEVQGNNLYGGGSYGNNFYSGQGMPAGHPYGVPGAQGNNPYGGSPYSASPYGGQGTQNTPSYGSQGTQGPTSYGGQGAQNNIPYGVPGAQGNNLYGNVPQTPNPYVDQTNWNQNPYGGPNNGPYGSSMPGNNQYGMPPYGNNPYSPYAMPQKKNNTGLIIGIVVAIIVLFIIAVGALAYKVVSLYTESRNNRHGVREEYNFDDDDWDRDRDHSYNDNDWYDDYGYDDDDYFYDDYGYDEDEYYTLHDDIKYDLSYSVEFDYYEYETDYDNVDIMVSYPVIQGDSTPNLEQLNNEIQSEIDVFTEYFEEEYKDHLTDDDYFNAFSTSYVTYMDEEKMSIVFSEYVYSNYYNDVYLYCINIDMENGVILENENILGIDDDFSIEFREKSDIQNGEISYLTMMSDQEMTDLFNSSNLIVFYTPDGMEIGFNFDGGWVTVTYEEYEQYLQVF